MLTINKYFFTHIFLLLMQNSFCCSAKNSFFPLKHIENYDIYNIYIFVILYNVHIRVQQWINFTEILMFNGIQHNKPVLLAACKLKLENLPGKINDAY